MTTTLSTLGALQQDITIGRWFTGEDKRLEMRIWQAPVSLRDIALGQAVPRDITGWTLSWMVKRHETDPDDDAIFAVRSDQVDGITLTSPLSGICHVDLMAEDFLQVVGNLQYHHELKREDVGRRTVQLYGAFVLKQAVHGFEVGS